MYSDAEKITVGVDLFYTFSYFLAFLLKRFLVERSG